MDYLTQCRNKIFENTVAIHAQLQQWRLNQQKIVFTNGCFDLIHPGHIEYLAKAAALADILILGLNTDASVQRNKGQNRPVLDQYARALALAAFSFTHAIVLFDEATPLKLIQYIKPDILVKGNDYKAEEIVGYEDVMQHGGQVITIELTPGYSTTNIISRIKSLD